MTLMPDWSFGGEPCVRYVSLTDLIEDCALRIDLSLVRLSMTCAL